jgi:hypothetical protein
MFTGISSPGSAKKASMKGQRIVNHGLPLGSIATSMLCAGLVGGCLYRWHPKLAQHPLTGFGLTLAASLLRGGLFFLYAPSSQLALNRLEEIGMAPVLQGLGTALILAIVEQFVAKTNKHEQQLRLRCALSKHA